MVTVAGGRSLWRENMNTVTYTSLMATSDSESVKGAGSRLERANGVRAELGLRPLAARQVEHDRSLAEPRELRLSGLIELCARIRLDGTRP
jgi:hypothetical protein